MRIKKSSLKPIARTLAKELAFTITVLLGVSIGVYAMLMATPSEHISEVINTAATASQNKPWLDYFAWLERIVSGDLGTQVRNGEPVAPQLFRAAGATLILVTGTLIVSLMIALPLAVCEAMGKTKSLTRPLLVTLYLASALPSFWLAYVVIYVSTRYFNYFPVVDGVTTPLPITGLAIALLVLGSGLATATTRHLNSELTRVLSQDYITAAIAKGAGVWRHAYLEGVLLPTLEIIATRLSYVIGACVVVEQVLNWPGLGRLVWQAAQERDTATVMGAVLICAVWVALAHLFQRTVYILLNPRASHMGF